MNDSNLSEMLEYFGQEQACYTSLLDLSRRQRSIIESGDVDALMNVLQEKQRVLNRVTSIEKKLRPYKENWPRLKQGFDENDRQVVSEALRTVEELLAELIASEKESEDLLRGQRDEVRQELVSSVHGGKVHQAYTGQQGGEEARFLDIKE
ncbi:flagellar export chaperone FlgN [Kolteria novifilia]|uniref:flagellar export chaperone FlgN n=1 Tax=Kolteria novifilia TaxID=2527975 RepID=UPI003AF3544C